MRKALVAVVAAAVVAIGLGSRGSAGGEPPTGGKPASVKTQTVDYRDGDVACKGYLAYDPTISSLQPVVLVVGDWMGLNDFARKTAGRMVAWGYAGFAVDMYGGGKVAADPQEAGKLAGQFRGENRGAGRQRARAAFDTLKTFPFLDANKVAALGFCFGGTIALELAWSG